MAERTYNHPATGCQLILDPSQVYPDDPSSGTPAMVRYKGHYGTYWCASDAGEVDGFPIPLSAMVWLGSARIVKLVEALGA